MTSPSKSKNRQCILLIYVYGIIVLVFLCVKLILLIYVCMLLVFFVLNLHCCVPPPMLRSVCDCSRGSTTISAMERMEVPVAEIHHQPLGKQYEP